MKQADIGKEERAKGLPDHISKRRRFVTKIEKPQGGDLT